jgi:hypothetical protein
MPVFTALPALVTVVRADETSIKMLGTEKRAFMWAFLWNPGAVLLPPISRSRRNASLHEIGGRARTGYGGAIQMNGVSVNAE